MFIHIQGSCAARFIILEKTNPLGNNPLCSLPRIMAHSENSSLFKLNRVTKSTEGVAKSPKTMRLLGIMETQWFLVIIFVFIKVPSNCMTVSDHCHTPTYKT